MAFPSDFLDEVRARHPIANVVQKRVKLTRKGRLLLGLCPFHNEKTPSFTVYEQQDTYHCFGCGVHGDVFSFKMQTEGLSFLEAVENLALEAGLTLPNLTPQTFEAREKKKTIFEALEIATDWYEKQLYQSKAGEKVLQYLEHRHLRDETLKSFRVGFAPEGPSSLINFMKERGFEDETLVKAGLMIRREGGRTIDYFRDRLLFPIFDKRGAVIAFGGRILGEGEPKYLNSPETEVFHKSNTLYGLHLINRKNLSNHPLLVVEGFVDVMMLKQEGFQAVAPLGTAITELHIAELWRLTPTPCLCLDGDLAGQNATFRAAERALPNLKPGKSLSIAVLPQGEDPDSLIKGGGKPFLEKLVSAPQHLVDFLWERVFTNEVYDTPEKRALLEKKLISLAETIKDLSVKQYYKAAFKSRIFEVFSGALYGKKRKNDLLQPLKKAKVQLNTSALKLKILFAGLLNHPQMIYDVGEKLAELEIIDKNLIKLRDEIFFALNEHRDLDEVSLKHHLNNHGHGKLVQSLLSETIYVHAHFARPHVSIDMAREGWLEVWQHLLESKLFAEDIKRAQSQLSDAMSSQSWKRMQLLFNQAKTYKQKSQETSLNQDSFPQPSSNVKG